VPAKIKMASVVKWWNIDKDLLEGRDEIAGENPNNEETDGEEGEGHNDEEIKTNPLEL